jgi:hypothetical protein
VDKIVHLTIEESAVRVQRCGRIISQALQRGELEGVRKGKRIFIPGKQLDEWARRKGLPTEDARATQSLVRAVREVLREAKQQRKQEVTCPK